MSRFEGPCLVARVISFSLIFTILVQGLLSIALRDQMYKTRNLNLTCRFETHPFDKFMTCRACYKIIDIHNSCDSCIMENRKRCWKFDIIWCQTSCDLSLMWKSTRNCICNALSQCLMMQLRPASAGCTFPVPVEMDQTSEIWWKFKFTYNLQEQNTRL